MTDISKSIERLKKHKEKIVIKWVNEYCKEINYSYFTGYYTKDQLYEYFENKINKKIDDLEREEIQDMICETEPVM